MMYPILSGMKEGQERSINKAINFSLALSSPLVITTFLYASIPLSFFGTQYLQALPLLEILMVGALFFPIYAGYYGYIYAKGYYKHVIILGITFNGSRIVLYYILVIFLGEFGIALSYSLGVICVLFTMVFSIKKLKFSMDWIFISKIIIIPIIIGFFLFLFKVIWFIGIPILILISFILYIKLNVVTKNELNQIISNLISEKKRNFIYQKAQPLIQFLFKED